jgi:hypothetical protein
VDDAGTAIIWVVVLVALVVGALLAVRPRARQPRPGPGTAGTVYDWLNEEKRNAVEIIVEDRAAARDPEHRDGNLPELETPKKD